jgi:hypothetical protein
MKIDILQLDTIDAWCKYEDYRFKNLILLMQGANMKIIILQLDTIDTQFRHAD